MQSIRSLTRFIAKFGDGDKAVLAEKQAGVLVVPTEVYYKTINILHAGLDKQSLKGMQPLLYFST